MAILPVDRAQWPNIGASKGFTYSPRNSVGAAITPSTMSWRLVDGADSIVNSRSSVSVTPATSVNLTLDPADHALTTSAPPLNRQRKLIITYAYTDATYGSYTVVDQIEYELLG